MLRKRRHLGVTIASLLIAPPALSQTADQFKRVAQSEFLKTSWRTNRDLAYRATVPGSPKRQRDVEISVRGLKEYSLVDPKSGEQVNAASVSASIPKNEAIVVRKIELMPAGVAFELEAQKHKIRMLFAPETYSGYDLEKFKENILCRWLLIAKYEPGRALD